MGIIFRNYDPGLVSFSFFGIIVTGFQDGTFIEAERSEDGFTMHVGATGDVTRVMNRNRTGKITVTLMAQSPANDALLAIAAQDEQFGTGVGAAMVKDINTLAPLGPLAHAKQAWIEKIPKVERAKDASPCVWVFGCSLLDLAPSGAVF